MRELLRQRIASQHFTLSLCTKPLMPAHPKHMKIHSDKCAPIQTTSGSPYITVAEFIRLLLRAARDLEALSPHRKNNSVAVLRVEDVESILVYLARTAAESGELLADDIAAQAKDEVAASLKATDIARKIISAAENLSAESLVRSLIKSPQRDMTMQVLKQATRGGTTVISDSGHLSDRLSKPLQQRFPSSKIHRITARISRESSDGTGLLIKVTKCHNDAEFWQHFALSLHELKVADEDDYNTLMLARLMGTEVDMDVSVTVCLPKGRLTRESISCDLASPIDRVSVARRAMNWLGTQYSLPFTD